MSDYFNRVVVETPDETITLTNNTRLEKDGRPIVACVGTDSPADALLLIQE